MICEILLKYCSFRRESGACLIRQEKYHIVKSSQKEIQVEKIHLGKT